MSAESIARWNALPLTRTEQQKPSMSEDEPPQPQDDDNDDDNVSLVSRSPSPLDRMDVDSRDIHKYDEYVRGAPREVITIDTKIKPTNKGFSMLAKLGWVEGQPLGLSGEGRVDPIPFQVKQDLSGLGKISQDVRMIETTVSQRRGLDSERQQKETDEQRKAREDLVARKAALESEISTTLRAFYCTLCDKQFKTVAQYDEHTNSYAHHHKARFKDMQANIRLKPKEEIDKRKEKERKREEKELRKIAAANGIKMPKPSTVSNVASSSTVAEVESSKPVSDATIASIPGGAGSFKKSGWATIGVASAPPPPQVPPPPRLPPSQPFPPTAPPPPPTHAPTPAARAAPNFRAGGWTVLDTGSTAPATTTSQPLTSGFAPINSEAPGVSGTTTPAAKSTLTTSRDSPRSNPVQPRTGWQQFQKANARRK